MQDIAFYDDKNGVAVGQLGKFLITNDGGITWKYDVPTEIFNNGDSAYGPLTLTVAWAGKNPIVGSYGGNIYRYEGNYFNFDNKKQSFSISGRVTEDKKAKSIALTNGMDTVYSNTSNGLYEFTDLSVGTYEIKPFRYYDTAQYHIAPSSYAIKLKESINDLDFELERKRYNIKVKFTHNEEPLEGIEFYIRNKKGNFVYYTTGSDGTYLIENEASREVTIFAPKGTFERKYEPFKQGFYLLSDTVVHFEAIYPDEFHSVSGRVTKAGEGLENARIRILSKAFGDAKTMTYVDGYYSFDKVPESIYTLNGPKSIGIFDAFEPNSFNGLEIISDTSGLDFNLSEDLYRISGYVMTPEGKGIPNINIRIVPDHHDGFIEYTSDTSGYYISDFIAYTNDIRISPTPKVNKKVYKFSPEMYEIDLYSDTNKINFVITELTDIEIQVIPDKLITHPNPTTDKLHFKLEDGIKTINIFNLHMQEVKTIKNIGTNTIDIMELPAGVYFLEVVDENNNVYFEKIIKK